MVTGSPFGDKDQIEVWGMWTWLFFLPGMPPAGTTALSPAAYCSPVSLQQIPPGLQGRLSILPADTPTLQLGSMSPVRGHCRVTSGDGAACPCSDRGIGDSQGCWGATGRSRKPVGFFPALLYFSPSPVDGNIILHMGSALAKWACKERAFPHSNVLHTVKRKCQGNNSGFWYCITTPNLIRIDLRLRGAAFFWMCHMLVYQLWRYLVPGLNYSFSFQPKSLALHKYHDHFKPCMILIPTNGYKGSKQDKRSCREVLPLSLTPSLSFIFPKFPETASAPLAFLCVYLFIISLKFLGFFQGFKIFDAN